MTNQTGGGGRTPKERWEEGRKLLDELRERYDELEVREQDFFRNVDSQDWCSPKQLAWLMDLKDKYLG